MLNNSKSAVLHDLRGRVIRLALRPARPAGGTGMAVRLLRVRHGLTQRQLAARSGFSRVSVSRWERSARPLRPEVLGRLLDALRRG